MVAATLASMRHYCPEVPICLIADGDVDVSDLEKQYDLIVLRIDELPLEDMRKMIGGSYRVKLAAMWEIFFHLQEILNYLIFTKSQREKIVA